MAVEQRQLFRNRCHHCRRCGATEELSLADAGHGRCATQQRSGDGDGGLYLGAQSSRRFAQALAKNSRDADSLLAVRVHREEFFEEAADFALAVDEVNFQNPMARPPVRVRLAQGD